MDDQIESRLSPRYPARSDDDRISEANRALSGALNGCNQKPELIEKVGTSMTAALSTQDPGKLGVRICCKALLTSLSFRCRRSVHGDK